MRGLTLGLQQVSDRSRSEMKLGIAKTVSQDFFHTFRIFTKQKHCRVTDCSALTFDLQLQGVREVPLGVGHVTFVHS